jgi:hypothetical protein
MRTELSRTGDGADKVLKYYPASLLHFVLDVFSTHTCHYRWQEGAQAAMRRIQQLVTVGGAMVLLALVLGCGNNVGYEPPPIITMPAAPTVTAVTPVNSINNASVTLTLTGTNFQTGDTVLVGGQACTGVSVLSSTMLTCQFSGKPMTCGGQNIQVTTSDGKESGTLSASKGLKLVSSTFGFVSPQWPAVGKYPRAIAEADFNGDGKPDLAVANVGDGSVSVLLADGLGGFSAAKNFSVGLNPVWLVAADFNGDGKPDLVAVATAVGNNVSVLLGDGLGGFSAATNFATGQVPSVVATGDFNGDGKPDLVAGNAGSDNLSVLLGDGSGKFSSASGSPFSVPSSPTSVAVGDFNGDGKPDLAVTNFDETQPMKGYNLSILLGDGEGGFAAGSNLPVAGTPLGVVAVDVNGDMKTDLIVSAGTGSVVVFLGNGKGGFSPGPSSFQTFGIGPLAVGDLNGDGILDVAATGGNYTSAVWVLLGDGKGGFSPPPYMDLGLQLGADTYGSVITIGDFNGDGNLDLAMVNSASTVSVLLGDGLGGFATNPNSFSLGTESGPGGQGGYSTGASGIGDFNGDGKPDIAVVNVNYNNVSLLLGSGANEFALAKNFAVGTQPGAAAVSDFNGDGLADLVVANFGSGNVSLLLGNAINGFTAAKNFAAGMQPYAVAVGDFNRDGFTDLVVGDFGSNDLLLFLGDGKGGFAAPKALLVQNSPSVIAVGDFNNDGNLDLVSGSGNVDVLLGDGTGHFAPDVTSPAMELSGPLWVGDFNSDGNADLFTQNAIGEDNVALGLLLGNGKGSFAPPIMLQPRGFPPAGLFVNRPAVTDFNGDGKMDVIATDEYGDVGVLLGNGTGDFAAPMQVSFGLLPFDLQIGWLMTGDLNNDGQPDLVIASPWLSGGSNYPAQGFVTTLIQQCL